MKNFVAILAAGKGTRMGIDQPKQFLNLNGKTVLEHSLDVFHAHSAIDGIVIIANPDLLEETKNIARKKDRAKLMGIVPGGKERFDSSLSALKFFDDADEADNLLIHDAARPFVSEEIITRVVESLRQHEAVSVAIPASDTVYLCENGVIRQSPERNQIFLAQTPQAARIGIFRKAFALAEKQLSPMTDDANVILNHLPEIAIHIVSGDPKNKKITYPEDIDLN